MSEVVYEKKRIVGMSSKGLLADDATFHAFISMCILEGGMPQWYESYKNYESKLKQLKVDRRFIGELRLAHYIGFMSAWNNLASEVLANREKLDSITKRLNKKRAKP